MTQKKNKGFLVMLLLAVFLPELAYATKPTIPWNIDLSYQEIEQNKVRLQISLSSRRQVENLELKVQSSHAELLSPDDRFVFSIGAGEVKSFNIDYRWSDRAVPHWKVLVEKRDGAFFLSRVARISMTTNENQKMRRVTPPIRQGVEEYRLD